MRVRDFINTHKKDRITVYKDNDKNKVELKSCSDDTVKDYIIMLKPGYSDIKIII